MKTSSIAGAAALAGALLATTAATAAAATPPKFTSELIVPNASIGGITLNGTVASAKKILGSGCTTAGCSYTSPGNTWELSVIFGATSKKAKPKIVSIAFSETGTSSSLPALKTARGIGLGSTAAAVKQAYPKLLGSPKTVLYTSTNALATTFQIVDGHVASIAMHSVRLG